MVAVAYLPALRNDFVNWDDTTYLIKNEAVHSPGGLGQIWSTIEMPRFFPNYPIVFTTYWLEYRLWGDWPAGYHATNILLHAANTSLVFALVLALGGAPWVAALTAALFGLHPLQAESVVWITERKNVLSTFFGLLAMLAYLRHRRTERWCWYALAVLAFVLGLLSKTALAPLPLSLLLLERMRNGRWQLESFTRLLPLLALAGVVSLMTLHIEDAPNVVTPAARPLLASAVLWFYGGMLLVPWNVRPLYPMWDVAVGAPIWWMPLVGLLLVVVAVWRWAPPWRSRWGMAHFVCLLLPVLGLRPFGFHKWSLVANHHVYLASIGFFLVLAEALYRWRLVRGRVVTLLVGVVLLLWCGITEQQIAVWRDSVSLWSEVLVHNPGSANAQVNLGNALLDLGQLDAAEVQLRRGLAGSSEPTQTHTNLGRLFFQRGQFDAAAEQLLLALAGAPNDSELHKSLALVRRSQERLDEAADELHTAIKLQDSPVYRRLLGGVLLSQGHEAEAIAAYQAALEGDGSAETRHELGEAYLAAGHLSEAAAAFTEVVRQHPEWPEPHYNLAVALRGLGDTDAARRELGLALRIKPDFALASAELQALDTNLIEPKVGRDPGSSPN